MWSYFYCNSLLFEQLWLVSRKVLLVLRQAIIRVIRPACTQARFHIYIYSREFSRQLVLSIYYQSFRKIYQICAKDTKIGRIPKVDHSFSHQKQKSWCCWSNIVGLQSKPFLMSAGGEELSAFVESWGVKCFGDISNIDLQSISKMTNNSKLKTVSGD